MMNIEIESLRTLRISPDEVLVVSVPTGQFSQGYVNHVKQVLEDRIPGIKVIVMRADHEIFKISKEDAAVAILSGDAK